MTYSALELSTESGRPVELYQFNYTGNFWYYTSADTALTLNGTTYKSMPMIRTEVPSNVNTNDSGIKINLPRDAAFVDIFRVSPPSEPVIFTVYSQHYLDSEFQVIAKGRVLNCEWLGDSEVQLVCESIFTSLQRNGLRRRVTAQCVFNLYGDDCGVLASTWKVETVLTSFSGLNLTVNSESGKPVNWYAGGKVTWLNAIGGNLERRMIRSSTNLGVMTLSSIPIGLVAGQAITVYPGCSHTLEDANGCVPKFNNAARYGGTPFMPTKKPFSGSSLY